LKPQFPARTESQHATRRRFGFRTGIKSHVFSVNINNPYTGLPITSHICPCNSPTRPHIHKTEPRQNLTIEHQARLVAKRPHGNAIRFKHERFRLPGNIAGICQAIKQASRRLKCVSIAARKNNHNKAGKE
jgi:hypothetical protein